MRYLGVVRTPRHLLLVMELAAGGSLAELVPRAVAVGEVRRLLLQLAEAVCRAPAPAASSASVWAGSLSRSVDSESARLWETFQGAGNEIASSMFV